GPLEEPAPPQPAGGPPPWRARWSAASARTARRSASAASRRSSPRRPAFSTSASTTTGSATTRATYRSSSDKPQAARRRTCAARPRHEAGRPKRGDRPFSVQLTDIHGRLEGHAQPAPHGVPQEGEPADHRAGSPGAVGGDGPLREDSRRAPGETQVRPARRPALRQRADPSRHGAQQDPQGLRRQVSVDGGLRLAVSAGLRLPRPADRAEGGPRAGAEEA